MATDEVINEPSNTTPETGETAVKTSEPTPVTASVDIDAKMNELFDKFNTKIDDMTKNYNSKIDELNNVIKSKDDELTKLKNVNAAILMGSSLGAKPDGKVDFNSVEFDEVDWDKEASDYMKALDSRLFS